jgi:drug/metabolite transporter (DMT)-like permease
MEQIHIAYKFLGGAAALFSAAAWALGSILFRRLGEKVSPLGMNLGKGIIGILYLGILILLLGREPFNARAILNLGISGILGIALGDTLFFTALMYIGPRLTILLGMLGPVFTVILAVAFLGERPSFLAWTGIILTTAGVTWVLLEQECEQKAKKKWILGVSYALLSAVCTSVGIILAKVGVASVSALAGTFIRLFWGTIGLTIWGLRTGKIKNWLEPFRDVRVLQLASLATFVAIFGGFWLFLVALKYIDASCATILNSTTPLFIIPMAAIALREKISLRAILGSVVAVSGIALVFIR